MSSIGSINSNNSWSIFHTSPISRYRQKKNIDLEIYRKRFQRSELISFIKSNRDLLTAISKDEDLIDMLRARKISTRADLIDIIVKGALKRLGPDSPIKRKFLEENIDFAKLIALNVGDLADILKEDKTLADIIANKNSVEKSAIINHVIKKVTSYLGSSSPVTERFLADHPDAAIHLLLNPALMDRVKSDQTVAERFVARAEDNLSTYRNEIAARARDLINMPGTFTTEFFTKNQAFAKLVVASALNGEPVKLPFYLKANPDLTLRIFSSPSIIKEYETSLAKNKLPSDFPLRDGLLSENRPIVSAIIGSDKFVEGLKRDKSLFTRLFSRDIYSMPLDERVMKIISTNYQPVTSARSGNSVDIYV